MEVFRNWQWLVSDEYVERADGGREYFFEIGRVGEIATHRGKYKLYDWPSHMAEKTWVDVAAFNEAFERALRFQSERAGAVVDEEMLQRSLADAHRIEERRDA